MSLPTHVLPLEDTFAERLPGFFVECQPVKVREPKLLKFNELLADELNLDTSALTADIVTQVFSGNELPEGMNPIAQAYAGHQFGGFVPQLGDGRALLLGEVVDGSGERRDIALKGSGRTPFSRGGDGNAAVGPVLREYLIGEAMHALRIPTTRALAAVSTGETVIRETPLPGAILTRVAASHIRVGTFEYFAARGLFDKVRELADYVIERHYPGLAEDDDRYLLLFKSVAERQAELISQWMLTGFIHGVMNTDNMTISGETIDYGPCAFMEAYRQSTVFSSIDRGGRYAYANQPYIGRWNLARLGETLLPLIDVDSTEAAAEKATIILNDFIPDYECRWLAGALAKLGITECAADDEDKALVDNWLKLLEEHSVDYTLAWRRLADAADGDRAPLESLFPNAESVKPWIERWQGRLNGNTSAAAKEMRALNPIYIPRNHLVEEALSAASDNDDLSLFEKLLDIITKPFEELPGCEKYAEPASEQYTACYKTFCGT